MSDFNWEGAVTGLLDAGSKIADKKVTDLSKLEQRAYDAKIAERRATAEYARTEALKRLDYTLRGNENVQQSGLRITEKGVDNTASMARLNANNTASMERTKESNSGAMARTRESNSGAMDRTKESNAGAMARTKETAKKTAAAKPDYTPAQAYKRMSDIKSKMAELGKAVAEGDTTGEETQKLMASLGGLGLITPQKTYDAKDLKDARAALQREYDYAETFTVKKGILDADEPTTTSGDSVGLSDKEKKAAALVNKYLNKK